MMQYNINYRSIQRYSILSPNSTIMINIDELINNWFQIFTYSRMLL